MMIQHLLDHVVDVLYPDSQFGELGLEEELGAWEAIDDGTGLTRLRVCVSVLLFMRLTTKKLEWFYHLLVKQTI